MINNYDRIYQELQTEAQRLGDGLGIDPEILVRLILEVVDLEDQHRVSPISINKKVRALIQTAAAAHQEEGLDHD